ncbi:MAG: trimethylamine methyltransferase family protein [Candidatus Latescibacteria bacterium]|nr:trimethylamine methyltransferase family protein [Candidatus Latescibacterota bacterium]
MYQRGLVREQDVEPLGESVVTVLERVGALYQSDEILNALGKAGARVDANEQVARFPKEMTSDFLQCLRSESDADQQSDDHEETFRAPGLGWFFHQLSPYVYDAEKREKRLGNREDYIELIKLCDVLHPERGTGHCLLLSDVPAFHEPLEVTLLQFEYARKPTGAYVQDVGQIDYLNEMADISGIEGLTWLANVGFSSPLRLGKDVADRYVAKIRRDNGSNLYIMTISGAGLPVTVAGCVTVGAAEFMANWMAARSLNPDVRLTGGSWIATMDMRASSEHSYTAPDAMMRNFALREFMRRWTGISVGAGGGEYCPAKVPGPYAALEKAHAAMTVAAFTGRHPGVGSGHLDGGLVVSPVQLLLDREMAECLGQLEGPIDASEDAIGLEGILDVGHAARGNYMGTDHTYRHFRSSLWLPQLLERAGWSGAETEEQVVRRAQDRVNDLIASYHKPDVDEDMLARLRQVIDRARRSRP